MSIARRSVAGSTIARRIRINRFDDENGPCSGFEARRRCKNSAQFMLRSTTTSIRSAISSLAKLTRNDEPARWPSGAPSRPNGRLGLGVLRHTQTTGRYSDRAQKVALTPVNTTDISLRMEAAKAAELLMT